MFSSIVSIWSLMSMYLLSGQLLSNIEMILFKMFGAILIHNLCNTNDTSLFSKGILLFLPQGTKKRGTWLLFALETKGVDH